MGKTVVGLFDDFHDAEEAVRDLVNNGFSRDDMSIITAHKGGNQAGVEPAAPREETRAEKAAEGAGEGVVLGGLAGLLMGITMLAIPGIGLVATAGPLAVALGGAVAGGLVGSLTHHGVPEKEANAYAEAVRRGGTLVTLHTVDEYADRAVEVMNRHRPVDLMQRITEWDEWTHFDEGAEPDHITQKRAEAELPPQNERKSGQARVYPHG